MIQFAEALKLLKPASDLYVAKGKKVEHIDLKQEKPDEARLQKLLLGPTGNMRAPTLRTGTMVVVGYNEEMYRELFG